MNHLSRTLLSGLVSGAGATWAKSQAEGLLQPAAERALPPPPGAKQKLGADPAGRPEDMPPSELADRAQAVVTDERLDDDQRAQASGVLHWAMGLGFAVGYAAAARRFPGIRAGGGLLAGTALFAATHGSGLPLAGLQPAPTAMPRAWWIWEGGSHLLYGVALDRGLALTETLIPAR